MRVEIRNTTLCCIDCSTYELAARALSISLSECRFEKALFLTDRPAAIKGVETRLISPLTSGSAYSMFVLSELARHIETEFVLLIQWDGYVLSGAAWDSGFLAYDYIGARWGHVPGVAVGNGGFSLRSRRLLQATASAPFVPKHPEDEAICLDNRALLVLGHCLRFAPPEIADHFSYERVGLNGPHFGFHGLFNFPGILAPAELPGVLAALPPRVASSTELLEVVLRYYQAGQLAEARQVWRRAIELRSRDEMVAFLNDRVLPKTLGPRMVADLDAPG